MNDRFFRLRRIIRGRLAIITLLIVGVFAPWSSLFNNWVVRDRSVADAQTTVPGDDPNSEDTDLLVIDSVTKAPIGGAQIQYELRTQREFTGADGHAMVPKPQPGYRYCVIYIKSPGYVNKRLVWLSGDGPRGGKIPSTYTLLMEQATKMSGKVVDDLGQPVADANVYFAVPNRFADAHEFYNVGGIDVTTPIKTKEDGTWTVNGVPANISEVSVGVWDYRYLTDDIFRVVPFPHPEKLYDGTAVISVPKCVEFVGKVTNGMGTPIAGATVSAGQFHPPYSVKPLVTDAEGKFTVGILPGSAITFTIQAAGYETCTEKITSGPKKEEQVIFLAFQAKTSE